jgi:hypothetical protein
MSHISSTISKLLHAAFVAALAAPLACGAAAGEDDASSAALPVQAATVPPTRCTETTVVDGDVVIATRWDASAYRCVSLIHGNLSVLSAGDTLWSDVDLSSLEAVHGDVLLAYAPRLDVPTALRGIRLGKLAAIVRDPPVEVEARAEPASAIATPGIAAPPPPPPRAPHVRGGRLVVSIDFGSTVTGDVAFALAQLSRVDADVTIGTTSALSTTGWEPPARVTSGLAKLATIHGNLRLNVTNQMDWLGGNSCVAPFLTGLRAVDGNVTFVPSGENLWGYALSLETIGGDLVVAPSSTGGSKYWTPVRVFQDVTSVGGAIRVTGQAGVERFDATAASLSVTDGMLDGIAGAPVVRDLRIERNLRLRALPMDARVVGGGQIVIRDNTSLSQCDVDAFLAKQRSLGWSGVATTGGNAPGSANGVPCL